MNSDEAEYLTVKEFADKVRMSTHAIYRMLYQNKLPHIRVGEGRGSFRIPVKIAIDALLK